MYNNNLEDLKGPNISYEVRAINKYDGLFKYCEKILSEMQLATYFIVLGKRVNKTILKISLYSTTAEAIMLQSGAFYKIETQKTFFKPITSNL